MATVQKKSLREAITQLITASLYSARRSFVFSALTPDELSAVLAERDRTWKGAQQSQGKAKSVKLLSSVRLALPWSERPAHALFASVIEQWKAYELEGLISNALDADGGRQVTQNTHLAAVLDGIAAPWRLGEEHRAMGMWTSNQIRDQMNLLLRTYLLDPTSQAQDRRKLGFARPLTTQDRYELLSCIWQCQIGLAPGQEPARHQRLWVTLDKAEYILDYPPAEVKLLVNGLTSILNTVGAFFTFWLNLSDPDQQVIEEVRRAFGREFWGFCNLDLTAGQPALTSAEKGEAQG
jgi:hypothetical protein